MSLDLLCSTGLLLGLGILVVAYGVRLALRGRARHARVDKDQGSLLLGKSVMEMAYWLLDPIARALVVVGVTANGVTLGALGLTLFAGGALAFGHFGVAAVATVVGSLGDAVDGLVARYDGTSSDSGEVLDAAADRYAEFFGLAGIAYFYRNEPLCLGLALLTILGSFMISYGSAKAEALQVEAPRGAMRRAERAVYIAIGIEFVPFAQAYVAKQGAPSWLGGLPILIVLAFVGVIGNISAVRRLMAVARAVSPAAPAPSAVTASAPLSEPLRVVSR